MKKLAAALFVLAGSAFPVAAADPVKIGFLTTLAGPGGVLGKDMLDGFELAVKERGGKLGGMPVEVIVEEDQTNPSVGIQKVNKLLKSDKVDFIAGVVWSHVMQAIVNPIAESGKFLIGANAGPSPMAGKGCHENVFVVSFQNDQQYEAMGAYLTRKGPDKISVLAANYQAGKDAVEGFKRTYKGTLVEEIFTKVDQPEYSAEIARTRASGTKGLFITYAGGMAINWVKQYSQAQVGIPMYTGWGLTDETVLPAIGDAALGIYGAGSWARDLPVPANKKFVADFEKTHKRIPSHLAATGYDAALLLDAALAKAGAKRDDPATMRAALRTAKFASVRGDFAFNNNHFPKVDWVLRKVVKEADGRLYNSFQEVILKSHGDAYAVECPMKW